MLPTHTVEIRDNRGEKYFGLFHSQEDAEQFLRQQGFREILDSFFRKVRSLAPPLTAFIMKAARGRGMKGGPLK